MTSLRTSINMKCKDCIYDPLERGAWREQVSLCSCTTCPLWPVRPMSESEYVKKMLDKPA